MKFIAATNFHNAPELPDAQFPKKNDKGEVINIVPKGTEFELAPGVKTLKNVDNANLRQTISKLVLYGFAIPVDDTDESKDAQAKLKAEIAAEKAAAAKQAKSDASQVDATTALNNRISALEALLAKSKN